MAYEFKKLSAVEAVEAVSDAASVLIEENGVIKRAPKDEVGGIKVASTAEVGQTIVVKAVDADGMPTEWECADMSGGEKPDMVITVNGQSSIKLTNENCSITEGSMDNVFAAFHAGRYPILKIRFHQYDDTAYTTVREEYNAYVCTYGNNLWFSFIALNPLNSANLYVHKIYMAEDGTISNANLSLATLTSV